MAKKQATAEAGAPVKKAAAPKKAAKAAKSATKKAAKAAKPAVEKKAAKPVVEKKAATAAAPKKKVAAVKLNDKQKDLLTKVKGAGEPGYKFDKAETRGIKGLQTKKLVKLSKDKETKEFAALLTKAGEKALAAATPTA